MTSTSTRFQDRLAPCGDTVDGERYEFRDGQGFVTDQYLFACGCRVTREEYHDGCIEREVVRHDGKLLMEEELHGG